MRRLITCLFLAGHACALIAFPALGAVLPEWEFPPTALPTGAAPHSIAVGDFNEDGRPDIATANRGNSTISVLLQGTQHSFDIAPLVSSPGEPYSIATGDLDRDGHLDLVTGAFRDGVVRIYRGLGDGSFLSPAAYTGKLGIISVAVNDMNGDLCPDVVTGNYGSGSASYFPNLGDGRLGQRLDIPAGGSVWAIAVGDVDGNAIPDMITANEGSNTVSVIRSLGNGLFAAAQQYSVGPGPRGVAVADLDLDGDLDIAAQNGSGTVTILTGDGDGSFSPSSQLGQGSYAFGIAIGDLNNDGLPDIASAQNAMNSVSFLLAELDGGYQASPGVSTGYAPRAVAIADLDDVPGQELIIANEATSGLRVLFNITPSSQVPSVTTLQLDSGPSYYGETIELRASVTPDTAQGTVTFRDGGVGIGTASLVAGVATLQVSKLPAGTRALKAIYTGSTSLEASKSAVVNHDVLQAPVTVSVVSSPNPSEQHLNATFVISVQPVRPTTEIPTGQVRFRVDQQGVGVPTPLTNGSAIVVMDTLPAGAHTVEAFYDPPTERKFAAGNSAPYTHTVTSTEPYIVGVSDVPHDQGGRVFVKWQCSLDRVGINIVTGYQVWRRIPETLFERGDERFMARPARAGGNGSSETYWEFMTQLPAAHFVNYGYTSATVWDSSSAGNAFMAYFIRATTVNPLTWFDSPVDSGCSVDNLAPATPSGAAGLLSAAGAELLWRANPEPDLREYRLYRGQAPDFEPSPATLVAVVQDTTYTDDVTTLWYYRVAAVDIHGNASPLASFQPVSLPGGPGDGAVAFALKGAFPNPSDGRRPTVMLSLPVSEGARLEVLDITGRRMWTESLDALGAGTHTVQLAPERPFPAGIYLLRLVQGGREKRGRFVVVD